MDNTDGSYELWYAVRSSGTWLIEIQFRSTIGSTEHFTSVPHLAQYLEVYATSASASESFMISIPHEIVAGTESSAQLQLRDHFGNNILHGGHNITFEIKALTIDETGIMADSVRVPGRVVDLSTGTYKGFFTMPLSGTYDLSALVTQDSGRKVAARAFRIIAKSASCSSNAPFRCPDKSCKISYAACAGGAANITVCPPPGRPSDIAKCHDGSCVTDAALCPCPNGTVKCPTISVGQAIARCVTTITECPVPRACSAEYPFLCADGNCRASESDCPMAISCPPTMVACPDGLSCAASAEGCVETTSCPEDRPVRCLASGLCVLAQSECESQVTCTSGGFLCPDNRCRPTLAECPMPTECASGTILCPGGSCARSRADCPQRTTCKTHQVLCEDGRCADDASSCGFGASCSLGQVRCSDGTCRPTEAQCPSVSVCSAERPIKCEDGSCASRASECPEIGTCGEQVRCPSGSCAPRFEDCETMPSCPDGLSVMCPDGTCK